MTRLTSRMVIGALARALRSGRTLTGPGRVVLSDLLLYGLEGTRVPAQAQLADELGMGEARVREAVAELHELGLVFPAPDPEDGRRHVNDLNRRLIAAWVKGEYELTTLEMDREITRENRGYSRADTLPNRGDFETDTLPNRGLPRARSDSSSSSASSETEAIALEIAAAREFEDGHKRAIQSLRDWGVPMPRGAQRELWEFMRRGIQFEDADAVARACGGAGTKSWNYAVKCFEERLRAAADGRVVEFDQYRGNRPWHFNETGGSK